jgi:hypothetical protein
MNEGDVDELRRALEAQYGAPARLVRSVAVLETSQQKPIFGGMVHIFDLEGHPASKRIYAWWSGPASGKRSFHAVRHEGPVTGPEEAVRGTRRRTEDLAIKGMTYARTGSIRNFGVMKQARAIQCDGVKLAVGISRRGARTILVLPTLSGKPLLLGPVALDMATARRIGAELLRMAASNEGSQPRTVLCGQEGDEVISAHGGKRLRQASLA